VTKQGAGHLAEADLDVEVATDSFELDVAVLHLQHHGHLRPDAQLVVDAAVERAAAAGLDPHHPAAHLLMDRARVREGARPPDQLHRRARGPADHPHRTGIDRQLDAADLGAHLEGLALQRRTGGHHQPHQPRPRASPDHRLRALRASPREGKRAARREGDVRMRYPASP
jgi:hypothetical protein